MNLPTTAPARLALGATALGIAATCGYLTGWHRLRGQLAAVQHTATHDPLTGAHNRAGLTEHANAFITTGHRAVRLVIVALVDLVGFKAVNDAHGHDAGDHILTTVAKRLTGIAGPAGLTARLGGDEFAFLTTGPALRNEDAHAWLSDRLTHIHARLTTPVGYHGRTLAVGATIGAVLATPDQPAPVWLHRADLAMYAARAHRRTTAIHTTDTAPDDRPIDRPRDLARPTSHLGITHTGRAA